MADTKISDLTAASELTGAEEIPCSDGTSTTKAATATQVRTFALTPDSTVAPASYYWCKLSANYTLTNTLSAQKLFNSSTNGELTLPVGVYFFECMFYLLSMSASSGNAQFRLVGAGTATTARVMFQTVGLDTTTATNALAPSGSFSVSNNTVASMVVAATGASLIASHRGTFDVTVAGTIIPSIALVTGAAAVVQAGSHFKCWRAATSAATASAGPWS